jgi:hypothetical protein
MPSALTATRVARDIDVLSRAGLDLETFLEEATLSIGRAIPSSAACKTSFDPSTLLLTSTFKFGRLQGWDENDHEWGLVEFGTQEASSLGALAAAERPAMAVQLQSPDSRRVNEFLRPIYGIGDELRVTMRDRDVAWGGLAFHRDLGQPRFDLEDVELLASLSPVLARGVRSGILTVAADSAMTTAGPAVIIVDSGDQIIMVNDAAEQRMAELMTAPDGVSPAAIIGGLIGAARRYSAGEITRPHGVGYAAARAPGCACTPPRCRAATVTAARWRSPSTRPGRRRSCRWSSLPSTSPTGNAASSNSSSRAWTPRRSPARCTCRPTRCRTTSSPSSTRRTSAAAAN